MVVIEASKKFNQVRNIKWDHTEATFRFERLFFYRRGRNKSKN